MLNGKKESSGESQEQKRVSDFIPEGASTPDYPGIKDFKDKDVTITVIAVGRNRVGDVGHLLVTISVKGKDTVLKITQRKVVTKLLQVADSLPLTAKFVRGARVWDVV